MYFWIIKILCTTVGESFADYVNETLGFGLDQHDPALRRRRWSSRSSSSSGSPVRAGRLLARRRARQRRRHPADRQPHRRPGRAALDEHHRFAVLLVVVFGRLVRAGAHAVDPLDHHPQPRGLYWLTVLVTFALGTAAGDWTLELTGWTPGPRCCCRPASSWPSFVAWRLGAGPVLCFWLAYILTRPLGANIGDYLASDRRRRAGPGHAGDEPAVPRSDRGHRGVLDRDQEGPAPRVGAREAEGYDLTPVGVGGGVAGRGLTRTLVMGYRVRAACSACPTVVGGPGVYRAYGCRLDVHARCRGSRDRWRHGWNRSTTLTPFHERIGSWLQELSGPVEGGPMRRARPGSRCHGVDGRGDPVRGRGTE